MFKIVQRFSFVVSCFMLLVVSAICIEADDYWQIFKVRADGQADIQLTNSNCDHHNPQWSPDGNWIVYNRVDATDRNQIYKVDTTGAGSEIALTSSNYDHLRPRWSPDGQWIAYFRSVNKSGALCRITPIGGNEIVLYEPVSSASASSCSWSPNSDWICFPNAYDEVWKVDSAGNNAIQLTTDQYLNCHVEWSPDGNWVGFSDNVGINKCGIFRVSKDGGVVDTLVTGTNGGYPGWSPDGAWICYKDTLADIWKVDSAGNNNKIVYNTNYGDAFWALWSPDGNWICYRNGASILASKICKVDTAGGNFAVLSSPPNYCAHPQWSFDGQWIVYMKYVGATGIELVYFTATARNRFVELKWQSSIENNALAYSIIRRKGENGNYEELTRIPAQNTSSLNTYTYEDHAVECYNTYWYKLGLLNTNNNIKWYKPVEVVYTGKDLLGKLKLTVVPTLSNQDFCFAYDIAKADYVLAEFPVNIKIFDGAGRVTRVLFEGHSKAGSYSVIWDAKDVGGRDVKSGIYFCRLEIKDLGSKTTKLMVIR
jgi:Tol biopolymer transport system component